MFIVVLVTAPSKKEAKVIAGRLLKEKVIACANILEGVESLFWWQGKIDRAKEVLLVLKSRRSRLAKIIRLVKAAHSYKVPEIIALPIQGGSKDYLRWIDESLGKSN